MPTTESGRNLVKSYLDKNKINISDLAKMYGIGRQDATDYISGNKVSPAANRFILSIIHDFKITWKHKFKN